MSAPANAPAGLRLCSAQMNVQLHALAHQVGGDPSDNHLVHPRLRSVVGGIPKDRDVPCHVLVAGSRFEFACEFACCSQALCCRWPYCPVLTRAHIAPARPPHALRDMAWPPRALRSSGRAARSHRLRGGPSASPRHAAASVEGPGSIERLAIRASSRSGRRAGPSRASLRSGRARSRPRRNPQVARARRRADQPRRANRPQ